MKKINLKEKNAILYGISVFIIIISIMIGVTISIYVTIGLNNLPEMNIDGTDFAKVIKMMGFMTLPVLSIFIVGACLIVAFIIDGILWGVYELVRRIRKKIQEEGWKAIFKVGMIGIILILLAIILGISIIKKPMLKENTIGAIAYDYDSDSDYTIYIKENEQYVPYLVLAYNYNHTNNAIVLRKNVIGGQEGYIEDFNGTISKDKIYDGWIEMQKGVKYQETDVDRYLTGEFLRRFDSKVLNKIANTQLSFSKYGYEAGVYDNDEIKRQFFILSLTELNDASAYQDHQTKNKMKLKYFNNNSKTAVNDFGVESPYWTRTSDGESYYLMGYTGVATYTGSGAKFGVRPAFTIPNDTKITKVYDKNLMKEIYVLDLY